MFWAYEGTGAIAALLRRFLGGNQTAFDFGSGCRADVASAK
jgi:hypothetical protein